MNLDRYKVTDSKFYLKKFPTEDTGDYKDKEEALKDMEHNLEEMKVLQEKLYAENKYSLVVIIQAMDAAGKDGVIEHVMSGINPQGCHVVSFKSPSSTDLDHDYLWRISKELPERGKIGIFNRSHYEDVLVVKVHNLTEFSQLPDEQKTEDIWKKRYQQIKNFENYLYENGIIPIKIFLNISKEVQGERLLARIEEPEKNWKFNLGDLKERGYWKEYMDAFQDAIENTATKNAPWYVVPADKKWFARILVSNIIVEELKKLDPKFPTLNKEQREQLEEGRKLLLAENIKLSYKEDDRVDLSLKSQLKKSGKDSSENSKKKKDKSKKKSKK